MLDSGSVRGIVQAVLEERYPSVRFEPIQVRPGEDHDGDPVYWIDLVYDAPRVRLDPRITISGIACTIAAKRRFRSYRSSQGASGIAGKLKPLDLIETARRLAQGQQRGRPSQADLRRATSSAYDAMFHCLAQSCADALLGRRNATRERIARQIVCRGLDHGFAKQVCTNHGLLQSFPGSIRDSAYDFVTMQSKRHAADYDPALKCSRDETLNDIDNCESLIRSFVTAPIEDRRTFATYLLFRRRT